MQVVLDIKTIMVVGWLIYLPALFMLVILV